MALVSHTHKFIFIKTHKTASTSTEMFFEPACAPPGWTAGLKTTTSETEFGIIAARGTRGKKGDLEEGEWTSHMVAKLIVARLPAEQWNSYRKFANVRNPFDRVISKFLFRRFHAKLDPYTDAKVMLADFDGFVKGEEYKSDFFRVHVNKKYALDDVIRFEDLPGEIGRICKLVGYEADLSSLPHARDNSAARLGLSVGDFFADPALTERVLTVDKWMFDHCGYSPDPKDA
jgi:hypothetical protein